MLYYWFGAAPVDNTWCRDQFRHTLGRVQKRYTPKLNVELSIAKAADGLIRNDAFVHAVFEQYRNADKDLHHLRSSSFEDLGLADTVRKAREDALAEIRRVIPLQTDRYHEVDWIALATSVRRCSQLLLDIASSLPNTERTGHRYGENADKYQALWRAARGLRSFASFAGGTAAQLSATPALLLAGVAGSGKTHYLCDIVSHSLDDGGIGIMLLAEQFTNAEPMRQIIDYLGLNCTADEFLGALDAAAAHAGRGRALLVIDALNEAPGDQYWQTRLARLMLMIKNFSHLALIVSFRSEHREDILDATIRTLGVEIEHEGFRYAMIEAQQAFFSAYNVKPTGPYLSDEYQNPLFLKMLCEMLHAQGLHHVPPGVHGVNAVFTEHLRLLSIHISKRIGEDSRGDLVAQSIHDFASEVARKRKRLIPFEEARSFFEARQRISPKDFRTSLLGALLSEDILAEFHLGPKQRFVRFMYERLCDHAIARDILDRSIERLGIETAHEAPEVQDALKASHYDSFAVNIIYALAKQIPERLGREIFDITGSERAHRIAIAELPSRDPRYITTRTAEIVRIALQEAPAFEDIYDDPISPLLDALITLAIIPSHPLDAAFLHSFLNALSLANRDALWTVRVNLASDESALRRVFAWIESQAATIADSHSRRCVGIVLCWLLTASHRPTRDRATKALVALIHGDPSLTPFLLERYAGCNDPYVVERLLAAIYGASLRSPDPSVRASFAQAVYRSVFIDGTPPVHILSREYARLTVELVIDDGSTDFDPARIRPPYGSQKTRLTATDYLDWKKRRRYDTAAERAVGSIRHSIGQHGDFARYVVGLNSGSFEFIDVPLRSAAPVNRARAEAEFDESLSEQQRALKEASILQFWEFGDDEDGLLAEMTRVASAETQFEASLSEEQHALREAAKVATIRPNEFDLTKITNWIFRRVMRLGFDGQLFGNHDELANRGRDGGEVLGLERIGKKYTWIAYHELLARCADNYWMHADPYGWSEAYARFDISTTIRVRDIDPSSLLAATLHERDVPEKAPWWAPVNFFTWNETADLDEWLRHEVLPDPTQIIDVRDDLGQRWIAMDSRLSWRQPTPLQYDRYDVQHAQLLYGIKAFIIHRAETAKAIECLTTMDLERLWDFRDASGDGVLLGEYPAGLIVRRELPYELPRPSESAPISEETFHHTAIRYSGISGDTSQQSFSTIVPSPLLARLLNLHDHLEDVWTDATGTVAFDPAVRSAGPQALLVRSDVLDRLSPEYDVLWVLQGETRILGGHRYEMPGRLAIGGTWRRDKTGSLVGVIRTKWVDYGRTST